MGSSSFSFISCLGKHIKFMETPNSECGPQCELLDPLSEKEIKDLGWLSWEKAYLVNLESRMPIHVAHDEENIVWLINILRRVNRQVDHPLRNKLQLVLKPDDVYKNKRSWPQC